MMKNAFNFTLKALFDLKIFKFLRDTFFKKYFFKIFKRLDQRDEFNFKDYDIVIWETNNFNIHIDQ